MNPFFFCAQALAVSGALTTAYVNAWYRWAWSFGPQASVNIFDR
jgi:hypothetical protein